MWSMQEAITNTSLLHTNLIRVGSLCIYHLRHWQVYTKFWVEKYLCPNCPFLSVLDLHLSMCFVNYIISFIGMYQPIWLDMKFILTVSMAGIYIPFCTQSSKKTNRNLWLCPLITVSLVVMKIGSHAEQMAWDWLTCCKRWKCFDTLHI